MDVSKEGVASGQRVAAAANRLSMAGRFALGSFVFFIIFIGLSYLINMVAFAKAHAAVTFFRPDDHALVSPLALSLTTLVWSFLISASYMMFGKAVPVRKAWLRGITYGVFVFLLFIWQQEVFYFQFVDFPVGILWGALLHMAIAFPLGCMLISVIQAGRWN